MAYTMDGGALAASDDVYEPTDAPLAPLGMTLKANAAYAATEGTSGDGAMSLKPNAAYAPNDEGALAMSLKPNAAYAPPDDDALVMSLKPNAAYAASQTTSDEYAPIRRKGSVRSSRCSSYCRRSPCCLRDDGGWREDTRSLCESDGACGKH